MMDANGFFGHVAKNHMRSVWLFMGFAAIYCFMAAMISMPILLFVDRDSIAFIDPLRFVEQYGLYVVIFAGVQFVLSVWLYKWNIQNRTGYELSTPFSEPRLHRIVGNIAITAGLPVPEIAIINTTARNAFVTGFGKNSSTLVVTHGLLATLNDDELAAVIAHEITHIVNGDTQYLSLSNVAVDCLNVLSFFNFFNLNSKKKFFIAIVMSPILFFFLIGTLLQKLSLQLARVSRLLITSSREYIADAEAVRLTHNPYALISALKKIQGVSRIENLSPLDDAMMIDGLTHGEWATHPTIDERIAILVKYSGSMAFHHGTSKDTRYNVNTKEQSPSFGTASSAEGNQAFARSVTTEQPMFGQSKAAQAMSALSHSDRQGVNYLSDTCTKKDVSVLERVEKEDQFKILGMSPIGFAVIVFFSLTFISGYLSGTMFFRSPF